MSFTWAILYERRVQFQAVSLKYWWSAHGQTGCHVRASYRINAGSQSSLGGFYDWKTCALGDAALCCFATLSGKRQYRILRFFGSWSKWNGPVDLWRGCGFKVSRPGL